MATTSPLLRLPPELQIVLAEHVDGASLLALRLTSTELAANTFEVLTRRFFAFRRHVATNKSLRILRNITATPAFVCRIKRLELVAIGVDLEYDEYQNMPGAFPVQSDVIEPWCRKLDDAYGWQDSGVLDEIFENLANARAGGCLMLNHSSAFVNGRVYTSSAFDPTNPTTAAFAAMPTRFHGLLAYVESVLAWADLNQNCVLPAADFLEVTLRALFRSSYRPESIDLLLANPSMRSRNGYGNNAWRKPLSLAESQGLEDLCGKLKGLHLDLNRTFMIASLPVLVAKMLSQMHALQYLGIGRTTTCIAAAVSRLLPPIGVKSIYIGGVFGPFHSLRFLLSRYGNTCEEFSINHSCLSDEAWGSMFHVLLHHYPKLLAFRLKAMDSMQATGEITYHLKINGTDGCDARGKGEVTKILTRLLKTSEAELG